MVGVHTTSVFFTGVPLFVEGHSLRKHFESVGHITDFRLLGPTPGKDFRYGFADYLDFASAEEAVQRLNGTSFGERTIKVTSAAHPRGRKRYRHHGYGHRHLQNHRQFVHGGMNFPRGYGDPLLGRDDTSILECLQRTPVSDAYEAVEQLRVLALERKAEARELLDSCPALRLAVVMILQHAGRLPYGPLPPGAVRHTTANAPTASDKMNARGAGEGAEGGAKEESTCTGEERDEVIDILTKLSEDDVERIVTMSDEELNRIADPAQRQQMAVLRERLLDMVGDLE